MMGASLAAITKRKREARRFPACPFEEALAFAIEVAKFGSGHPVRRLSLFDHLGKSPESRLSRTLITSAGKYGLTKGGYQARRLKLTEDGARVLDDNLPTREQVNARIKLAIHDQEPFSKLYERFKESTLPERGALLDSMKELAVPESLLEVTTDIFIVNLRFLGLVRNLSGVERLLAEEFVLNCLPSADAKQE